jgi:hypothetical protein
LKHALAPPPDVDPGEAHAETDRLRAECAAKVDETSHG